MKKRILALILMLSLAFSICAFAVLDNIYAQATIEFRGETAVCTVNVDGQNADDEIEITVKLWNGGKCLETWYAEDVGSLRFQETADVESGKVYGLTASITVNGVSMEGASDRGTCP